MKKTINFSKRNFKELLRDPLVYIFCIAFPLVMLILFHIINHYSHGSTPIFELSSLLPSIIMFSYTFVMLNMALIISKDRQSSFLKRLYSSPMKSQHFIFGYALVGLIIGLIQTIVCIVTGYIISLFSHTEYVPFINILLLVVSQLPILITFIFFGIIFGTIFNDKSAPGLCSIIISMAGMLGGCWMPLDTMAGFENFCRIIPFYPSVYIGRITTVATKTLGEHYIFDNIAIWGVVTIITFMILSIVLAIFIFKKKMTNDN